MPVFVSRKFIIHFFRSSVELVTVTHSSQILSFFFFCFHLQNGDRLFIGAPGSWYWQGKLIWKPFREEKQKKNIVYQNKEIDVSMNEANHSGCCFLLSARGVKWKYVVQHSNGFVWFTWSVAFTFSKSNEMKVFFPQLKYFHSNSYHDQSQLSE